jgi:hypothetical protein
MCYLFDSVKIFFKAMAKAILKHIMMKKKDFGGDGYKCDFADMCVNSCYVTLKPWDIKYLV